MKTHRTKVRPAVEIVEARLSGNEANTIANIVGDRYITTKEASLLTGMSIPWFEYMRWKGGGIPFIKLNHAVRYRLSVVLNWMESRTKDSTPEVQGAIR